MRSCRINKLIAEARSSTKSSAPALTRRGPHWFRSSRSWNPKSQAKSSTHEPKVCLYWRQYVKTEAHGPLVRKVSTYKSICLFTLMRWYRQRSLAKDTQDYPKVPWVYEVRCFSTNPAEETAAAEFAEVAANQCPAVEHHHRIEPGICYWVSRSLSNCETISWERLLVVITLDSYHTE